MTGTNLIDLGETERRARAAGLSINALCQKAGIWPSTWQAWKKGRLPQLAKWQLILGALDAAEQESARQRAA